MSQLANLFSRKVLTKNSGFSRFISLLLILLNGQTPVALAFRQTTKAEEVAYQNEMKLARSFMASGNCVHALTSLKKSMTMPHFQMYHEDGPVLDVLQKCPKEPDRHIALALYYIKRVDERYNNQINECSWTPQADYELWTAIDLSPQHRNAEAEQLLKRLAILKAKAAAVPYKWKNLWRYFYIEILTQRWKPPSQTNHMIVRLDVDALTKKPFVVVPSPSGEFDQSAMKALKECVDEYPFFEWGAHNANFAFMSSGTSKRVEGNNRSIVKDYSLDAADQKTAAEFLEHNLKPACLSRYFENNERCTYKIESAPERADHIVFCKKTLKVGERELSWSCLMQDGKPEQYNFRTVQIGGIAELHLTPSELRLTGEQLNNCVDMQRVRNALFSCVVTWQLANNQVQPEDQWFPRQPKITGLKEHFVQDGDGKIVAYECNLKDGRKVFANLTKNFSITKILVDGQVDEFWQKAYENERANAKAAQRAVTD